MSSSVYLAIPVMLILAILHAAVFPFFPILGFAPLIPFLVALAWGLLRGVNEGVLWAFVAGFFLDLLSATPLGLTSIGFILAIFLVVFAGRVFPSNPFLLPIIQAIVATFIFLSVHLLLLRLLGRTITFQSFLSLTPVAFLHGIIILPLYWLLNTLSQFVQPRRVQI